MACRYTQTPDSGIASSWAASRHIAIYGFGMRRRQPLHGAALRLMPGCFRYRVSLRPLCTMAIRSVWDAVVSGVMSGGVRSDAVPTLPRIRLIVI